MAFTAALLIAAGAGILTLALRPAARLIAELPEGKVKARWNTLRALIMLFLAGYLGALAFIPGKAGVQHLIEGAVFLAGAIFVLLVTRLMLSTAHDVRRITKLELENITDPLLGIYNRRYLEQRLQEEVSRANRYVTPLSLCIIDIDEFKRINDSFGHPVGDKVLRMVGGLVRGAVRAVDIPARVGGDEFAVLLPATSLVDGAKVAQRIRKRIEEARLEGSPSFTVSIGLAALDLSQRRSTEERAALLSRADLALYEAKRGGKNRIAFATQTASA